MRTERGTCAIFCRTSSSCWIGEASRRCFGSRSSEAVMTASLQEQFGQIDIYVFDQLLRGNIAPKMRVLDAGCGYGRNLVYLLQRGAEIFAVDGNADCVEQVRRLSESLKTGLPDRNFQVGVIEEMHFPNEFADVVMCN